MQVAMMQTVSELLAQNEESLSPLGAGVLAAAYLGVSKDSRSFSVRLGVAHALVLRECVVLADEHRLIDLEERGERSQKLFFALNERGLQALDRASAQ